MAELFAELCVAMKNITRSSKRTIKFSIGFIVTSTIGKIVASAFQYLLHMQSEY